MKLLGFFALMGALGLTGHAEVPACYQSVNRVVWLVQNGSQTFTNTQTWS